MSGRALIEIIKLDGIHFEKRGRLRQELHERVHLQWLTIG